VSTVIQNSSVMVIENSPPPSGILSFVNEPRMTGLWECANLVVCARFASSCGNRSVISSERHFHSRLF
jgi:hypothetical protein